MYNKEENEDPEEENIGDIRRHAYVHIDGGISSCAAEKLLHKLVKNKWIILVIYVMKITFKDNYFLSF